MELFFLDDIEDFLNFLARNCLDLTVRVSTHVGILWRLELKSNVPHVARNVWLSGFQMFVLFEVVINEPTFPLSHTLQATCGTLLFL